MAQRTIRRIAAPEAENTRLISAVLAVDELSDRQWAVAREPCSSTCRGATGAS
jgi:hypothetical protein